MPSKFHLQHFVKRQQEMEKNESVMYGRTDGRTYLRTEGQTDVKSEIVI